MRKIITAILAGMLLASMFSSAAFAGPAYGKGGSGSSDAGDNCGNKTGWSGENGCNLNYKNGQS